MKHAIESYKLFKYWAIYLLGFVILFFLFLIISVQVSGEPLFPDIIPVIGFPIVIASALAGIFNIIYAIKMKDYQKSLYGIAIFAETFVLFIGIVLVSLSQIF